MPPEILCNPLNKESSAIKMKHVIRFSCIVVFTFLLWSTLSGCKGSIVQNTPVKVIRNLYTVKSYEELGAFYTKGSLALIDKAVKNGLVPEKNRLFFFPVLGKDVDLEEMGIKYFPDELKPQKAVVTMRYIKHPVENMIGGRAIFNLVIEEGKWKIDREVEIADIIKMLKDDGVEEYLESVNK